MAAVKSHPTLD